MSKLRLLTIVLLVTALVGCAVTPVPETGTPGAETPAGVETPGLTETAPAAAETGTAPAGETGTPAAGETGTPAAGMTGTPAAGETGTAPAAGETGTPAAGTTGTPAAGGLRTPQEAALAAAGGEEIGGSVSVLATWGGSEQESFMAMIEPFTEATGITIEYEGTRDLNAVLTKRVQGGNPPDLAGLPGPGQMAEFAAQGALVNLADVLDMDTYSAQYADTWRDLGTAEDQLVGIFIKASVKGLIWYNAQQFEANGWEIPETWDELIALSEQILADTGTTPWSVALESQASSGWPGTDFIEDVILRQSGEEVYEQWYQGQIPWTSDEVRMAWETWGEIVANPDMVFGGANTMLTTNFGNVGDPLFLDPPQAYLAHQASFITDFFVTNTPGIEPVTDFDFFRFPVFNEGDPSRLIIAGDLFGMFNDTPQSRALINYLVTPEAQAIWVGRGGAISPNQDVPLDLYPDELSARSAEILTTTESVQFDGSDLMPEAMNNAFWSAILNYVQNPDDLENILAGLDEVRQDAFPQQ